MKRSRVRTPLGPFISKMVLMKKKFFTIFSALVLISLFVVTIKFYATSYDELWSRDFSSGEIALKDFAAEGFLIDPNINSGGYFLSNILLQALQSVSVSMPEQIFLRLPALLLPMGLGLWFVIWNLGRMRQNSSNLMSFILGLVLLAAGYVVFLYQSNNFYLLQNVTFVGMARAGVFFFFISIYFGAGKMRWLVPAVLVFVLASPLAWVMLLSFFLACQIVRIKTGSSEECQRIVNSILGTGILLSLALFCWALSSSEPAVGFSKDFTAKVLGWGKSQIPALLTAVAAIVMFYSAEKKQGFLVGTSFVLFYFMMLLCTPFSFKGEKYLWLAAQGIMELILPLFLIFWAGYVDFGKLKVYFHKSPKTMVVRAVICAGLLSGGIVNLINRVEIESRQHISDHKPASFAPLLLSQSNPEKVDAREIVKYLVYYRWVAAYNPKIPEAYGLQGYCSFRLKRYFRAIDFYKEAAALKPEFFWYNYNLGVIYFKQGRNYLALDYLHRAVSGNASDTFEHIMASKEIYLPILQLMALKPGDPFQSQFKNAHRSAFLMSFLIYYSLEDTAAMIPVVTKAIQQGLDDNGQFYYMLAYAMHSLKDYQGALTALKSAMANNAQYEAYLTTTMTILNRSKISKEVLDAFFDNAANALQAMGEDIDLEVF